MMIIVTLIWILALMIAIKANGEAKRAHKKATIQHKINQACYRNKIQEWVSKIN